MVTILITIVIINPYSDINYDEIQSYDIEHEYLENVINVTEAEKEYENFDNYKTKVKIESFYEF